RCSMSQPAHLFDIEKGFFEYLDRVRSVHGLTWEQTGITTTTAEQWKKKSHRSEQVRATARVLARICKNLGCYPDRDPMLPFLPQRTRAAVARLMSTKYPNHDATNCLLIPAEAGEGTGPISEAAPP